MLVFCSFNLLIFYLRLFVVDYYITGEVLIMVKKKMYSEIPKVKY